MNYYTIKFDHAGFRLKVINGKFALKAFDQFKLPEELEKLEKYFKKECNNDPGPRFFIEWTADWLIEQILTAFDFQWAHAYSMCGGDCYKYVCTEMTEKDLIEKLSTILPQLGIYVEQVHHTDPNEEVHKYNSDGEHFAPLHEFIRHATETRRSRNEANYDK